MNEHKHASPTDWVDPDDAPELTDAFFTQADEYVGERLVKRGKPHECCAKGLAEAAQTGAGGLTLHRPSLTLLVR